MAPGGWAPGDLNLLTSETTWDARQWSLFGRSAGAPSAGASDLLQRPPPDAMWRVQEAARLGLR